MRDLVYRLGFVLLSILAGVGLAACEGDPAVNAGNPIPNARAGLAAMYGGDLGGVDAYFCDQIVLSARDWANEAARGDGQIDFREAEFVIVDDNQANDRLVAMIGEYAIERFGTVEEHTATPENRVLIQMRIEDGAWKICNLGADAPAYTPTP